MSRVVQIWNKSNSNDIYHLWDSGDHQWLMNKDGEIRNYILCKRTMINDRIIEEIINQPEVPVPLESFYSKIQGYRLSFTQCQQEKDKDSDTGSDSYSPVYLPRELWLSLSQWIPPERFYQASLHMQANNEINESQTSASKTKQYYQSFQKIDIGSSGSVGYYKPANRNFSKGPMFV